MSAVPSMAAQKANKEGLRRTLYTVRPGKRAGPPPGHVTTKTDCGRVLEWRQASSYQGEWHNDKREGFGTMVFSNGDKVRWRIPALLVDAALGLPHFAGSSVAPTCSMKESGAIIRGMVVERCGFVDAVDLSSDMKEIGSPESTMCVERIRDVFTS